jgi:hypothetical protein
MLAKRFKNRFYSILIPRCLSEPSGDPAQRGGGELHCIGRFFSAVTGLGRLACQAENSPDEKGETWKRLPYMKVS